VLTKFEPSELTPTAFSAAGPLGAFCTFSVSDQPLVAGQASVIATTAIVIIARIVIPRRKYPTSL
jgi:hypothetical protein